MGSITHYSHFFLLGYLPGALALPLNTCHYCHCHYLTEQFFVCHKVAILLLLRYSFLCHVQWYFWKKIFVSSASRYYLSLAPRKTILFVLCNIFFLLSWSCKTISLSTLNNGISCNKCTTFSRPAYYYFHVHQYLSVLVMRLLTWLIAFFFEPILFLLSLGHRHVSHFYVLCYWYSIVLILCMIIFCIFIARLIHVYFLSISSLCLCNTIPVLARCNHESLRVIFSQLLLACTFVFSFLLLAP